MLGSKLTERPAILLGKYLDELSPSTRPIVEQLPRDNAACVAGVVLDQTLQKTFIGRTVMPDVARHFGFLFSLAQQRLQIDHRDIAALHELAIVIEHEGETARHAGCEVSPSAAQNDYRSASHVFAAVVTHTFNDGLSAGVAHGEAFSGDSAKVRFSFDRPVEHDVAGDHVLAWLSPKFRRWLHGDTAPRQAFTTVVVRLTDEIQGHTASQECAEALAGGACQPYANRVGGEPFVPVTPSNLTR